MCRAPAVQVTLGHHSFCHPRAGAIANLDPTLIINPLQEMITKSNDTWMRKQLKYVERNAKRLMHLVNQLMDYRRAELGVFKLKVRPENVHKIIKENWAYYEKLAQSKNIRYSLLSDLEDKTLNLDGQYLELILNNLLSNAFKYTESGSITVRATQHASEFILRSAIQAKAFRKDSRRGFSNASTRWTTNISEAVSASHWCRDLSNFIMER